MARINMAIFVSGSGTNCENLIKYFKGSELVNTALVVSNKPDAYALVRAERLGVPTAVMPKAELERPGGDDAAAGEVRHRLHRAGRLATAHP